MFPRRIEPIKATGFLSSYESRRKPGKKIPIEAFKKGRLIASDFFEVLVKLDQGVRDQGGFLFITDLTRPWSVQAKARKKFLFGGKSAFVAPPGGSFHNAGRAIDISIHELNFANIPKEEWLQNLWNIAKPLGLHPIIKIPDINMSEAWHFDYPGEDWLDAYKILPYGEAAKCCILDIGFWDPNENEQKVKKMFIQSQLIRLKCYKIGKVDGIIGPKTKAGLKKMGVSNFPLDIQAEQLALVERSIVRG